MNPDQASQSFNPAACSVVRGRATPRHTAGNRSRPAGRMAAALAVALWIALAPCALTQAAEPGAAEPAPIAAEVEADPLPAIQGRWAEVRYQLAEAQRAKAFAALAGELDRALQQHPQDLRLKVWKGIVLASQAGAQGGLGALSLCKQARQEFEAVIERDGSVLDGSAYTSLGSLYYQVPGWPLGFGDEDKARSLLRKGLEIAPQGIDANYFWADFLLEQKDYAGAIRAFEKALAAPPRPGRDSADAGRRAEIEAGLAKARAGLRG